MHYEDIFYGLDSPNDALKQQLSDFIYNVPEYYLRSISIAGTFF